MDTETPPRIQNTEICLFQLKMPNQAQWAGKRTFGPTLFFEFLAGKWIKHLGNLKRTHKLVCQCLDNDWWAVKVKPMDSMCILWPK